MLVAFLIALSTILFFLLTLNQRKRKSDEPPLISSWIPWIGSGLDFKADPEGFLRRCESKHGRIFTLYMGGNYFHVVIDPFTIPNILKETKKIDFGVMKQVFAEKVFGLKHHEDAPVNLPKHLQGKGLEGLVEMTGNHLARIIRNPALVGKNWREKDLFTLTFEVLFFAQLLTLQGDYDKDSEKLNFTSIADLSKCFCDFDDAFPYLTQGYPISTLKGAKKGRDRMWEYLNTKNRNKRSGGHEFLLELQRNLEEIGREQSIPEETFVLIWAAAGNTNATAFWVIYNLLKHPDAMNAINKEVREKFPCDVSGIPPLKKQELAKTVVLDSVILESLRLIGSIGLHREVMEDFYLQLGHNSKTYRLRKGDRIAMPLQMVHLDGEIFENPTEFRYNRFLDEDGNKEKTNFYKDSVKLKNYLEPFGMGKHKCPGRFWAQTELKQIVILLLTFYDIELLDLNDVPKRDQNRFMQGIMPPVTSPMVRYKLKPAVETTG